MSHLNPDSYKKLPYPPPPPTQALTSTTFRPPPLDGSYTISQMYDWHLENSPSHPMFVYSDEDGSSTTITWGEAVKAYHRAGRLIRQRFDLTKAAAKVPFLAFVAITDTITYWSMMAGAQRAGYAPFPLSPRNSPAAIAHLLTKIQVPFLFVGPEPAMQELVAHAFEIMKEAGTTLPQISTMPVFEDLYITDPNVPFDPLPPIFPDQDDPVIVMHSSGSTAFPKPIVWSNYRYVLLGFTPYFSERDVTGMRFACHATPMFHAMGMLEITTSACCGNVITAFKPQSPARMLSEDSLIKSAIATKTDILVCVPSFVETWSRNPEHVRALQGLEGVLFGGGPLSKEVGDEMTEKGVSLFNMYGASETGLMCYMLPKPPGKDWEYIRFPPNMKTHLTPQENGNVELFLLPNQYQVPCVLNYTVDGVGAYNTNDVLAPHPTKPGYWKIFGRSDDQIMHNTGEKTNPGPLENILMRDPHVKTAIIFGRGRFNVGVLIEPTKEHIFDPADQEKLVAYRNKIWPSVEKMNEFAPQHSRLFKEMITVCTPAKPFTYTAKNTPRRHAIIREYEDEIEALYAAVDESTQADLDPPPSWNFASAKEFVKAVVKRVLDHDIGDIDDLFHSGCDSLQATWIRNSLLHALRDTTRINTRTIPSNFVYRYPTIAQLSSFVSGLASSDYDDEDFATHDKAVEAMLEMVEKYTKDFPAHVPSAPAPKKDVVLLTGTTGGLGASLLFSLVDSPDVERIYAVNRKGEGSLESRQKSVLEERGIDVERVLTSSKVKYVEIDLGDHLGFDEVLLEEIRTSVTHFVHCAWPVNFNLSLSSFEPSVRTVRQFIDLALASPHPEPPTFLFISSIGVLRHIDVSKPVHEGSIPASVAEGTGYSESKWVSEQILKKASEATPLRAISVRVGQLTGSASGAWKQSEWVPSMIRSSIYLGCLPALDKEISWIPVDAAARAVNEMRRSRTNDILHLAHPRPVHWHAVMEPVSKYLGLPLVPYDEWYARLEKSAEGLRADSEVELMRKNPALKILEFFGNAKAKMEDSPEAMGLPMLSVTHAEKAAPSLGPEALPQLTGADALRWIEYWKRLGAM